MHHKYLHNEHITMKNFILSFTILLIACTLITSCGDNEEKAVTLQGEWLMREQTIKTSDSGFDNMLNTVFSLDLKENQTTRAFTELNVKTTIRKKGSSGSEGLISESTDAYEVKGDSIFIQSSLHGGTAASKYLITANTLTTYRKVTSQDIRNIVTIMGVDPATIPNDLTGELKIKEIR